LEVAYGVDNRLSNDNDRAMLQDDLIGSSEACQILGIKRSTLSRWASEDLKPEARKLTPAQRLSPRGPVLWKRSEVEALAEKIKAGAA